MKTETRYLLTDDDAMLLKNLTEAEHQLQNFRPADWFVPGGAWGGEKSSPYRHAWLCVTKERRFTMEDASKVATYLEGLQASAKARIADSDYPAPQREAVNTACSVVAQAHDEFALAIARAQPLVVDAED
jgi:hypothetical protein